MRSAALVALMAPKLDSREIAVRVHALIGGQNVDGVEQAADRLNVAEGALRKSIDALAPQPTLDVLAAIIREYGVDPCWLLFGEYDPATHRAAMESGGVRPSDLLKFAAGRLYAEQQDRRDAQAEVSAER